MVLVELVTGEQYDFKRVMQAHINKDFVPLLSNNGFIAYKKNRYVRERNQIVQIISFALEKDRVKVYAIFLPVFLCDDTYSEYGIELTGWNGFKLLGGKYYTTLYEKEKVDKEVQYRNYLEQHIISLEKIYLAIKEGIIPEMDKINSLVTFVEKIQSAGACFFGYEYYDENRKGWLYQYIESVYKCINTDFNEGITTLKMLEEYDYILEKELKELDLSSREAFMISFDKLCDKMRKYYKLI